jgi:hypothetical protein
MVVKECLLRPQTIELALDRFAESLDEATAPVCSVDGLGRPSSVNGLSGNRARQFSSKAGVRPHRRLVWTTLPCFGLYDTVQEIAQRHADRKSSTERQDAHA